MSDVGFPLVYLARASESAVGADGLLRTLTQAAGLGWYEAGLGPERDAGRTGRTCPIRVVFCRCVASELTSLPRSSASRCSPSPGGFLGESRGSAVQFLQNPAQCRQARRLHARPLSLAQWFQEESFQFQSLASLEIDQR